MHTSSPQERLRHTSSANGLERQEAISPSHSAAISVRHWVRHFKETYDLDYPSCLRDLLAKTPQECYKELRFGSCEARRTFIEHGMYDEISRGPAKIKFAISRDVVVYTNRPPSIFVPYQVPIATEEVFDVDNPKPSARMSRGDIWALLTTEERTEIFELHYEVQHEVQLGKLRSVMESRWYTTSMTALTAGLTAMKQNLRLNNKRCLIDTFIQNARESISPALKKQRCSELLSGIDMMELFGEINNESTSK